MRYNNLSFFRVLFGALVLALALSWAGCSNSPARNEPAARVVFETGFETDAGGFAGRGGAEQLTRTDEDKHSGGYSLKIEGRTSSWHGALLDIAPYITEGHEYTVSLWVKLISPENAAINLSTQVGGGSATYNNLQRREISAAEGWVELRGSYCYFNRDLAAVYVDGTPNNASFYIDDLTITQEGGDPAVIQDLPALRSAYETYFLMGNIASGKDIRGQRFELLRRHFNIVTAENAMKPSELQPSKGVFRWDAADAIVDTALAAGMKVHGHTLVWHQQTGAWMSANGARAEALENLTAHIKTVAEHFKGRVISWDVVNEAVSDGLSAAAAADWKASLRNSPWRQAIGPEYIELAFLSAREAAGPEVKLYYNDYGLDNQNKALAVFNMVRDINARHPGLIDGIGMQGHYSLSVNPYNVELSLERFISLGVEVSVTELDINAGANMRLSADESARQGLLYARLFSVFKKYSDHIGRITFWGLDDGTSWRAAQNPTLFTRTLKAKDAFYAVLNPEQFIADHPVIVKEAKIAGAAYGTPVIDGTADPVWNAAAEIPIDQYLLAWQGAAGTAKALWDEANLYVLIQVNDTELDKTSPNAYEQDSVEVFVEEANSKTTCFKDGDGQYRVNFSNEKSFNPPSAEAGFVSAVKVSGSSYTVEMKIPFKTIKPGNSVRIGFDVQINDAKQGARQSIAIWNDGSGLSYRDTSGYGILELRGR